jgi:hypothetical protein
MAYITDENGNYKRTVRCGYCYEKGHNKSACPKRKVDLKDNIERYTRELAEDKFSREWEKTNTERYLRNAKEALHKMETRGQNRKCGFCGETGHTRRTCPERKRQTAEQLAKTLDIRKKVISRMLDAGFGPGALVSVGQDNDNRHIMAIVQSVDLGVIAPNHAITRDQYFYGISGAIKFQYVVPKKDTWSDHTRTNGSCYMPPEFLNINDIPQDEWYRQATNHSCEILSGVDISEDCLVAPEALDKKKVEKWVINNIVDQR